MAHKININKIGQPKKPIVTFNHAGKAMRDLEQALEEYGKALGSLALSKK